jgi:hypothetical protein
LRDASRFDHPSMINRAEPLDLDGSGLLITRLRERFAALMPSAEMGGEPRAGTPSGLDSGSSPLVTVRAVSNRLHTGKGDQHRSVGG